MRLAKLFLAQSKNAIQNNAQFQQHQVKAALACWLKHISWNSLESTRIRWQVKQQAFLPY